MQNWYLYEMQLQPVFRKDALFQNLFKISQNVAVVSKSVYFLGVQYL